MVAAAVGFLLTACSRPVLPRLGPPPTGTVPPTPTSVLPPNPDALLRWDKLPVHYCIDETNQGFLGPLALTALVERALAAWGVPTVDDGACAGGTQQGDGINEIGWGVPATQAGGRGSFEAGVTLLRSTECVSSCDPADRVQLVEADIVIDRNPPRPFRNEACAYSTVLHETGHFLGLDHLPAPAVMAAETSSCPQALTAADHAALVQRYGPSLGQK